MPALVQLLESDPGLERDAVEALGKIGPAAIPALVQLLRDPKQPRARRFAVAALAGMGAGAKPAVPDLIRALGDRDLEVRHAAVLALGAMGPAARDALPTLRKLAAEDEVLRPFAGATIRKIEGKAGE